MPVRPNARKAMPEYLKEKYTEEEFQRLPKHTRNDLRRPNRRKQYKAGSPALHYIKMTYNLSSSDFQSLLEAQNGVCAICKKPEITRFKGGIRRLCIDHDHNTGKVRGLLCNHCNSMLGNALDDITILKEAITYLGGEYGCH